MPLTPKNSHLRLVGTDAVVNDVAREPLQRWAEERRAEMDVAHENVAATMQARDPRWVLAARAYGQLEGAVLTPERRDRVMRTAAHLGVRPFDANLIIAIVQDRARRGETLADAASAIDLVGPSEAERTRQRVVTWWHWAVSISGGLLLGALLIQWLLAGG